jgi:hypothetical protein
MTPDIAIWGAALLVSVWCMLVAMGRFGAGESWRKSSIFATSLLCVVSVLMFIVYNLAVSISEATLGPR